MRTKNGKEHFSVLQATESWAGPGNEARVDAVLIIVSTTRDPKYHWTCIGL